MKNGIATNLTDCINTSVANSVFVHNGDVYIAGHEPILEMLDKAFSNILGSKEKWARRKAELEAGKRWVELIYH